MGLQAFYDRRKTLENLTIPILIPISSIPPDIKRQKPWVSRGLTLTWDHSGVLKIRWIGFLAARQGFPHWIPCGAPIGLHGSSSHFGASKTTSFFQTTKQKPWLYNFIQLYPAPQSRLPHPQRPPTRTPAGRPSSCKCSSSNMLVSGGPTAGPHE